MPRQLVSGALLLAALALSCSAGATLASAKEGSIARPEERPFDVVLNGGRVLDPQTRLDEVLNLGIRDGKVSAISATPLEGLQTFDVSGLVVAPGFIDVHAHGQNPLSYDFMVRDGVTTALDLELGAHGVQHFLEDREGKARIHYGVSAGHIPARIKLMHGFSVGHPLTRGTGVMGWLRALVRRVWQPTGYAHQAADAAHIDTLVSLLSEQLDQGGIGIGLGLAYTPGADTDEVRAVFALAARRKVPVFVHLAAQAQPDNLTPLETAIEHARATGASLHVEHIVSSSTAATLRALAAIDRARLEGLDVTTEVYPYTAASTLLETATFDEGWQKRIGIDYPDLQWVETGERLTALSFTRYRKQGGMVVIHSLKEDWVDAAIKHPGVLIASDAMPLEDGGEHPRSVGTHARVLGRYVREHNTLTLLEAVARMSYLPALRLEGCAPAMKHKGRVQLGADADVVVFDPATVIDRATYTDSRQPSAGLPYVLVNGTVVVREGALVADAFPGRPVRAHSRTDPDAQEVSGP